MPEKPVVQSIKMIWDHAPHNALTDIIKFRGRWYCTFREGERHVYGINGKIRLLESEDGEHWLSTELFNEEGIDLRDPKLSITPDGRLMLLVGGSQYEGQKYISRQPRVAFSKDGTEWSPFHVILLPHEWLWRVTWFQGKGYGASYSFSDPTDHNKEWLIKLFETENGIDYNLITQWEIPGYPNETTLQFLETGEMVVLVRRDKKFDDYAWIGTSKSPYTEWQWNQTSLHLGGPNFLILPNKTMWAAGRLFNRTPYGLFEKIALLEMDLKSLKPVLYVPSGGEDTSYPGMVYDDGVLWMSYYSSHEHKTAIYLAKIGV